MAEHAECNPEVSSGETALGEFGWNHLDSDKSIEGEKGFDLALCIFGFGSVYMDEFVSIPSSDVW